MLVSLLGCFPHDAHKRTIAQVIEGGAMVVGVGAEFLVNTGADCDQMGMPGVPNSSCRTKANALGDVGVALILGGLLGFVATISTAEEDKPPPKVDIKAEAPAEKPALKLPAGVQPAAVEPAPSAPPAGSAAANAAP